MFCVTLTLQRRRVFFRPASTRNDTYPCRRIQKIQLYTGELMDKHAYLIMAHDHLDFLKERLLCLDDSRNDIYLHIDRKAGSFDS